MIKGKIEALAFGGEGILRHEGYVVFVPFTAIGDLVTAEIVSKKKNFAFGKLLAIENLSPHRIRPRCPYFGTCGGCQLQHIDYASQVTAKQTFIKDALQRIAKVEVQDIPVVPATLQWHYRRHIRLKLKKADKGFIAGYTGYDNNVFVAVEECPIFLAKDNPLFQKLKPLLASLSNEGIEEATLRIIKTSSSQVLLAFSFSPVLPHNHDICQMQSDSPWRGIVLHSPQEQRQWGNIDCTVESLGIKARFSPFSFVQNHPEQSENLYRAILEALPPESKNILDLYCGIGLTSLLFARAGKKVIGVEAHAETIALAKENALANQLSVDFFAGKAEVLGVKLLHEQHPDTVLCNPPRTGLDPALVQALIKEKPACILYVSCMPATLARDLRLLLHEGYYIDKVQGFDMFPQTTHVETLVRCKLKSTA